MRAALLVFTVLVGAAPDVHAAAEGGGTSWTVLALHVLNFGFLLWLLNRFAKKPILDFISQRSFGIRHDIEAAEQKLADAESEIARLRERIAGLEDERERILDAAAAQAEHERGQAVERARETSARIAEDAQRVAAQEIERARQELRAEAAELATTLAGSILRDQLTEDDDQRLVREFVGSIGDRS